MNDSKSSHAKPIEAKAQEWCIRLRNSDDVDQAKTRAEFEKWFAMSLSHQQAYRRAEAIFEMSGILKGSSRHGTERKISERINFAGFWIPIGLAAAVAAILVTIFYRPASDVVPEAIAVVATMTKEVSTRPGEIREVRLVDGSMATLDTDSRIEINISKTERLFRLSRGRARFEVASDPRAFRVQVGVGELLARKAVFDVAFNNNDISVAMISGSADIRPMAQYAVYMLPPVELSQGSRFAFRANDFTIRPPAQSAERDWPSGWAEYPSIRLGELITQANQYAVKPIILDDKTLADLEVTGRFKISDPEAVAVSIQKLFDLVLIRHADGIHLRRRK